MKTALIQTDPLWEDPAANHARAAELVGRAAGEGCDLAVLPEMFTTGFSMDVSALEPEDGPTDSLMQGLAARHGINIIAGFKALARDGTGPANLGRAWGRDGRVLASYRKMHPFPLTGEDRLFRPGAAPVVFDLDGVPSSVFICYDLRFPEAVRLVAPRVKAVFFLANWPSARQDHWGALLKARAIENQCFVAGVNRRGRDGNGLDYSGGSALFGPGGEMLCLAGPEDETALCEFDPQEADRVRAAYPFLEGLEGLR